MQSIILFTDMTAVSSDSHKCTQVKGKFHPRRPRREVKVQHYYFFNLGARWGWVVNATPWPLYSQGRPGKAVPLQARSGPEGSRKLRFPDFVPTA